MKYKEKPVLLEAIKWTGDNASECIEFCKGFAKIEDTVSSGSVLMLMVYKTNQRIIKTMVNVGDYIVLGKRGEYYAYNQELFESAYQLAES